MAAWRHILAEPDGTELAEVFEASSRTLSRPLNGLPAAGFTVPLGNPIADLVIGATALERLNLLLKVYRDGTLMFVGPLVAAEEQAEGTTGQLSVSAAGGLWRLFRRMVGKSSAGYGDGTPLAMKDLGTIAANLILAANGDGDTGIRVGSITASTNSYVGPWYFKKVGEAIVEIGPGVLGGFDFEVVPAEPTADAGGVKIGTFNAAPVLSTARPNAAFEFGVGRHNVASYRRPLSAEGLANRAYHLAPGFPDAVDAALTPVIVAENAASIAARLIHEDLVQADLGPNALRQQLVDEHVAIRKQPRELVVFTPVPEPGLDYGTDFEEGDIVPGRAVFNGRVRFNADFRIYGVDFTVDDMGVEELELTLVNEGAA